MVRVRLKRPCDTPERFLAYLMTYGTSEAILTARKYFSDREFERALWNAPPEICDAPLGTVVEKYKISV